MVTATMSAWDVAAQVPDPELPMLTLADLGILRDVTDDGATVTVSITPTYSGCPALREMSVDLRCRLIAAGFARVEIRTLLHPAWTTDWITAAGRRKLAEAGIAPPFPAPKRRNGPIPLTLQPTVRRVRCPLCGSGETEQQSAFGATACKALYRCRACREPFEYVKEI
ncbi:MAG: 1,2-phenylacetyl-CoA epoxidase subunit PaaD [Actinomycetota bacterium]